MAAQQPSHRAYTVIKREGQDDFWLSIGAAFMHQDGDGFNVVLQALPIDGKIVLRLPRSGDESQPGNGEQQSTQTRPRPSTTRQRRS
jgi:hypothetical protein